MTGIAARIGAASAVVAGLAALAACQPQGKSPQPSKAPVAAGPQNACMQLTSAPGQQPPTFKAVAYDDPNLETCAVHLEGLRLEQKRDVIGVWNGVWIFASEKEITSATGLNESRYAVFDADQRSQIDQSLNEQLAAARQASPKPASSKP